MSGVHWFTRFNNRVHRYLGGTNLEILKFGIYIMFPVGWMYYFGMNEKKFEVPDFWPTKEHGHRFPHDREELKEFEKQLTRDRLEKKKRRLEREARERGEIPAEGSVGPSTAAENSKGNEEHPLIRRKGGNIFGTGSISKWVKGER